MVDFNNESTVTIPPIEVLKIIILNRWWDLLEAREDYYKFKYHNTNKGIFVVKARTRTLFDTIHATLQRKMDKDKYKELKELVLSAKNDEDLDNAYYILTGELDKIDLLKIDTKQQVDRTKIEKSNQAAGYS